MTIYQLASGKSKEEVAAECAALRWGGFKPLLADALVEHLRPIQVRRAVPRRSLFCSEACFGSVLRRALLLFVGDAVFPVCCPCEVSCWTLAVHVNKALRIQCCDRRN